MRFTRISVDPLQMGGVPCIRHLRIPVATVVTMVSEGMSTREILDAYPDLQPDDIREALQFAAEAVKERELPLVDKPGAMATTYVAMESLGCELHSGTNGKEPEA